MTTTQAYRAPLIPARPSGKPLFRLRGDAQEEALAAIAKEIQELLQAEAPRSAVHQLPSPPLDLTGRAADLDALVEPFDQALSLSYEFRP